MKMNKLAAGALALALGLGAVAPAVAAEKDYTGAQLVLEKYEKELKDANAKRLAAIDAQAKLDEAQANFDAAEKALEAAKKAYLAKFPEVKTYKNADGKEVAGIILDYSGAINASLDLYKEDAEKAQSDIEKTYIPQYEAYYKANKDTAKAELIKYLKGIYGSAKESLSEDAYNAKIEVFAEQIILLANSKTTITSSTEYKAYVAAQYNYSVAADRLQAAKDKYQPIIDKYEEALKNLKKEAFGYGYVVQVGNNGLQLVKPEDPKVESPKKFNIKELKAAREKALQTLEAVKLLEELAPKKIADVKAELNKLVEEQKALIKLADKYLAKEMALVSTAYAAEDEEEMSPEELTNKLNEKSDKIQDLIKDKEEDKKPEEKPEDKKPEEKKPEENKPAKKSGNNARTGIAGVAGVAGILAAASVAYAASKRD